MQRRKGISLTYKLMAFVIVLALVPAVFMSLSSINTYDSIENTVFSSIEEIKAISVNESQHAKSRAISRAKNTMLDVVKSNLRTTRDDKIDKYSKILDSIEKQAEIVAGYTEDNWQYIEDESPATQFDGMVWAGPFNTDQKRQEHRRQLNKLSRVGLLLENMDEQESLTSLTYFGTRDNNVVTSRNISDSLRQIPSGFSNTERPWYSLATQNDQTVWTNTYVDANTHNLVTTAAVPVYQNNEILGVVGFDITLGILSNDILETDPGFAFLLDSEGEAIVYPGMKAPNKTVYAERTFNGTNFLEDDTSPELRSLAEAMVNGSEGIKKVPIEGKDSYVAYGPLEANDWSVGVAIPVEETVGPLNEVEQDLGARLDGMGEKIESEATVVKAEVNTAIQDAIQEYVLLLSVLLVVIIGSGVYFSREITDPIIQLHEKAESISKGGIGKEVEIHTGDEIEELADSFNRVIRTIKILQKRDAPNADKMLGKKPQMMEDE